MTAAFPPPPDQTPPPGYPAYPPGGPQPMYVVAQPPTSGLAVASLIFSILGLLFGCCTFGIFSLIAVGCGHAALKDIREKNLRGDGMAKAGLVMGYLLVGPMILISIQAVFGAGISAFQ